MSDRLRGKVAVITGGTRGFGLAVARAYAAEGAAVVISGRTAQAVESAVAGLTAKTVKVIATRTVPQGVAALMAFNHELDLAANIKAMESAVASVRTGQIATAVRSMRYRDISVKQGQVIGFVDCELAVAANSVQEVLAEVLSRMQAHDGGIITLYHGAGVEATDVEMLVSAVRSQCPEPEIEVLCGGQPHYDYLISVE